MPLSLAELQGQVLAAAQGRAPLEGAAAALGVPAERLAVYRRFVRGHVRTAVETNFSLTRAACDPAAWGPLVEAYIDAHPATHWRLDAAALAFAPWLAQIEALDPPRRALAELEAALMVARIHEAPWPSPPPGTWAVNPTLAIIEFPYPLVAWAVALGAGPPSPPPAPKPSIVLVFRRPADEVVAYHAAHPDWALALRVAHEGLDRAGLAAAGLPAAAAEAALAEAAAIGLVLAG